MVGTGNIGRANKTRTAITWEAWYEAFLQSGHFSAIWYHVKSSIDTRDLEIDSPHRKRTQRQVSLQPEASMPQHIWRRLISANLVIVTNIKNLLFIASSRIPSCASSTASSGHWANQTPCNYSKTLYCLYHTTNSKRIYASQKATPSSPFSLYCSSSSMRSGISSYPPSLGKHKAASVMAIATTICNVQLAVHISQLLSRCHPGTANFSSFFAK